MRARYTADRDGNLKVLPLPDPDWRDLDNAVKATDRPAPPRDPDGDNADTRPSPDDLRYDSAGHEIGKHIYL